MNNETSYFFIPEDQFQKEFFYVSLGNIFLLFLWRPPSCGGPGQLPSLPFLKSCPVRLTVIATVNFVCIVENAGCVDG